MSFRLCKKCDGLLSEDSYSGRWVCNQNDCNYTEPIKNDLWIDNMSKYEVEINDICDKLDEIIKVINKITNPRI